MSRRVRSAVREHRLSPGEAHYLGQVDLGCGGLSPRVRREFIRETAELLSERPEASGPVELNRALGPPKTFASNHLDTHGFAHGFSFTSRWTSMRPMGRVVAVLVPLALVIGGGLTLRWFVAIPELQNSCGGVAADEVEVRTAASTSEYVVTGAPGDRGGLFMCISSPDTGVIVESIGLRPQEVRAVQPVGAESNPMSSAPSGNAGAFEPFELREQQFGQYLWVEFDFCSDFVTDFVDSVVVSFSYRGRTRSVDMPLGYRATFAGDRARCDRGDEQRDAEMRSWTRSLPDSGELYGSLGLTAFNIGRDLCRYLAGVSHPTGVRQSGTSIEALADRAVFRLGRDDPGLAESVVLASLDALCPKFADRQEELVAMLGGS